MNREIFKVMRDRKNKFRVIVEVILMLLLYISIITGIPKLYYKTIGILFKGDIPDLLKHRGNVWVGMEILIILVLFIIIQFKTNDKLTTKNFKIKGENFLEMIFLTVFTFVFTTVIFYMRRGRLPVDFNGTPNQMIYIGVLTIILTPIIEELLFRQIILNKLKRSYNSSVSIVIAGVVFALGHRDARTTNFILSGTAFLFPYLYLKNNSIFMSLLSHFFYNFLSFTILRSSFYYNLMFDENCEFIVYSVFYSCLVILIILAAGYNRRRILLKLNN